MKRNNIYYLVLWYSVLTISVGILLDLILMSNFLIKGTVEPAFITLFFFALKFAFLHLTIELLKDKKTKFNLNFIFYYWVAQIFLFGFWGNVYAFTTGPQIAVYIKFVDVLDVGYILKFWTQELTLKINSNSDRVYMGLNAVPVLIVFVLTYVLPSTQQNQNGKGVENY